MARNQEKANSMLFRFRESKMNALGLVARHGPRPKMTSGTNGLRTCERYRADILKEISRKVQKISDPMMGEYEIRDLNDEINDLMRQKANWENRIIELGGANYKRAAVAMIGSDGTEVPGLRGYKYFGRAKELPGVREIFEQAAAERAEVESFKTQRYVTFKNVTPDYYGDFDDQDADLLAAERAQEEQDWKEHCLDLFRRLGMPEDTPLPSMPVAEYISLDASGRPIVPSDDADDAAASASTANVGDKRKAGGADAGDEPTAKKATGGTGRRILSVLKAEDLAPPKVPTGAEVEAMVLERQRKAMLEEYSV